MKKIIIGSFLSVLLSISLYTQTSHAAAKTGWANLGNKWYYYNSNGTMKTGWLLSGKQWYYLTSNGMATGWKNVSGSWYYFNNSGAMKTGWLLSGGKWYYLNTSGAMETGWVKIANKWYFFENSGLMKTGWLQQGEKWYYLQSNGAMAANTIINGYTFDQNGVWVQKKEVDNLKEKLSAIVAPYGVTVQKVEDEDLGVYYDLMDGDQNIGTYFTDYMVYGDPSYSELIKEVALNFGAPVTDTELNDLVEKAFIENEVHAYNISVYTDEYSLTIAWGFEE